MVKKYHSWDSERRQGHSSNERHHKKFIVPIMSSEGGFVNVFLLEADLVVPGTQV
jgi:hypothetical protein